MDQLTIVDCYDIIISAIVESNIMYNAFCNSLQYICNGALHVGIGSLLHKNCSMFVLT